MSNNHLRDGSIIASRVMTSLFVEQDLTYPRLSKAFAVFKRKRVKLLSCPLCPAAELSIYQAEKLPTLKPGK
jgi:hypothetical protein